MKRESVNFIRYILEEWIPPVLRDSPPMRWLFRACWGRLLVIVPLERDYRFRFNPHAHFFPYLHSFLRHILPMPANARCEVIGRNLLYIEDRERHA